MKKSFSLLILALLTSNCYAWDPIASLSNAVKGQVDRQISQSVSNVFHSITQPSVGDRPPDAAFSHSGTDQIIFYGTPNCGYCKKARAHMESRGIPYLEKDVSRDSQAKSEWRALGGRGVPFLVMGKRTLTGFSATSFDNAYRQFQSDTEQVESPTRASESTPSDDNAGYAAGDVLFARISRVKIHTAAQSDSPPLSQLDKHEEVICLGENQGRFLKVRSANAEGWVDESLLARH